MARLWFFVLPALVLTGAVGGFYFLSSRPDVSVERVINHSDETSLSAAVKAGQQLSNNQCKGTGPGVLTHSPMDPEDFSLIIPYGATIGGHVTPIDHQYFSPQDYRSPVDTYEVYAMADSTIVDIGTRTNTVHPATEYRLVFSLSCTFFYYYDLVTSLAPGIEVGSRVTAGQLIGKIGGRTLDFAVWDTEKPLTGFIVPEHYQGERWKLYTADPLDYYSPALKELTLSRYVRTAEPISGKIDYDVDGRLIGNWFAEGSGGYSGPGGGQEGYWKGHLSIAPDHYDPTAFIVSIGDFGGEAKQFAAKGNIPKPEDVSVETGLVKYDLVRWSYTKADGSAWDRMSVTKGIKIAINAASPIEGCALVQMIENRKLKMEALPGKACTSVAGFSLAAKVFER